MASVNISVCMPRSSLPLRNSATACGISPMPNSMVDPSSKGAVIKYLPGYDGQIHWGPLAWLLARLALALYLLSSALARFDRAALPLWEVGLRLVLCAGIMAGNPAVYGPAAAIAVLLLAWHFLQSRKGDVATEGPAPGLTTSP